MAVLAAAVSGFSVYGQSKSFKLGQWVEIENSVLKELNRSYVDSLPVDRMMRAGIDAMLENLDPYTIYIPEDENENLQMMLSKTYGGIGAVILKDKDANVIINEPYYGSPAWKHGLRCGDEIITIDGQPTKGLEAAESSEKMKGKPGTTVNFKVRKALTGDTVNVSVVRERIHIPDVEYVGMIDDTTGYIRQSGFTEKVSEEVKAGYNKLKGMGMKRLVLDLRGNGGGLMNEAINIVSLFVPKGSLVVSSKGSTPESVREYRTTSEPADTTMPLIIMVDSGSASSSEIVAGAIQDLDRGTIMGERTFGKGLVQHPVVFPDGTMLRLSIARYYTPSGRSIQKPYKQGKQEEYELDILNRYNHGELESADSVKFDESLKHTTLKTHRTVYGGGGIMPDVFVPVDTTAYSDFYRDIVAKGTLNNFVIRYVDNHRKELESTYEDDTQFIREFTVNDSMMEELVADAEKAGVKYDETQYGKSEPLLRSIIKALIARDIFDRSAYFRIANENEPIYREALRTINSPEYPAILNQTNNN